MLSPQPSALSLCRLAQVVALPAAICIAIQGHMHQLLRRRLIFQGCRGAPGFEVLVGVIQRFNCHCKGYMTLQRDANAVCAKKSAVADGRRGAAEEER